MLPGWFGFGSAVKDFVAAHPEDGLDRLKAMYRRWPFFRTQLSNMDMVLAKSSLAIASRYAQLVPDVKLREAIFSRISREWRDSVDALNAIMEQRELLQSNPLLLRSIRNRFPYLDPLNHVQVELLKLHRAPFGERQGADRHPTDDQRHFGGTAQQRVSDDAAAASQPIVSWPGVADVPVDGRRRRRLRAVLVQPVRALPCQFPPARGLWRDGRVRRRPAAIARTDRLGLSRAGLLRRLQGMSGRPACTGFIAAASEGAHPTAPPTPYRRGGSFRRGRPCRGSGRCRATCGRGCARRASRRRR